MECNVCLNEWNEEECIPRMLPCGHSYCEDCLKLLYQTPSTEKSIQCPKCLVCADLESIEALESVFPKNWALIALAKSHNTKKPTVPRLNLRMGKCQKRQTRHHSKLFSSLMPDNTPTTMGHQAGAQEESKTERRSRFQSDNPADFTFLTKLDSRNLNNEQCQLDGLPYHLTIED